MTLISVNQSVYHMDRFYAKKEIDWHFISSYDIIYINKWNHFDILFNEQVSQMHTSLIVCRCAPNRHI